MGRRYILRLGDGTILRVDQDGLNTWRADRKAMVQAAGGRWRPLKDLLAMQDAAAKHSSLQDASVPVPDASPLIPPKGQGLPSIPPKPFDTDDAAQLLDAFSPSEPPALSIGEAPDLQPSADEPAIFSVDPSADPSPAEEEIAPFSPPPLDEEEPPSRWRDPVEPSPIAARPSLQVLADDPVAHAGYTGEPTAPDDPLPSISLRPPDNREEQAGRGIYEGERDEGERDDFVPRTRRGDVLEEQFVQSIKDLGRLLFRSADFLERGYRQLRPTLRNVQASLRDALATRRAARASSRATAEPHPPANAPPRVLALADEPVALREEDPRAKVIAEEDLPIIRLKPSDEGAAPGRAVQDLLGRFGRWASALVVGFKARIDRLALARPHRPGPSGQSTEPAASAAAVPVAREPLKAPPSINELPVIRLAEIHEPEEPEDLYEGAGDDLLQTAGVWTKRIVLTTGLVAAAIYAAVTWRTWFPKAAQLGGVAATGVNEYVESRQQEERARRALKEATEQLPHLSPDTIRLVLSHSPTGVLDPPEVFHAASDAADQGLSALTPEEAEELAALGSALLDTLSPAERERLLEYGRVRSRRIPFAFEDRGALELFARGARALPSDRRERLQALLGKAIATGLARPSEAVPGNVAKR